MAPKEVLRTSYSIFKSRIDSAKKTKAAKNQRKFIKKSIQSRSSLRRECLFNRFCKPARNLFHVSIHSITVRRALLKQHLHFAFAINVKVHKHMRGKTNEMKRVLCLTETERFFARNAYFSFFWKKRSVFHLIVKFLQLMTLPIQVNPP